MHGKADLILRLADDLDIDEPHIWRSVARVSHIGKCLDHKRECAARQSNRDGAIAALNVGRLRIKHAALGEA